MMTKIKVLIVSVITLVVLNVSMIVFFMTLKPRLEGGDKDGPRRIIIEKLHFDKRQQEKYAVLIQEHRGTIETIENQIRQTKENLYSQLSTPEINENAKDSLINVLANYQKQIEKTHFDHFQKIKSLCDSPEQKEDFKALVKQLGKLFSGSRRPQPEENRGRRPE
ncbi:MAG: hypothetical protein V4497_10670 [Bacteroidota bacterium]